MSFIPNDGNNPLLHRTMVYMNNCGYQKFGLDLFTQWVIKLYDRNHNLIYTTKMINQIIYQYWLPVYTVYQYV